MDSQLDGLYSRQCSDIVNGQWEDFNQTLSPNYVGTNLDGPADSYASEGKSIAQLAKGIGLTACTVKLGSANETSNGVTTEVWFTLSGIVPKDSKLVKRGDHIAFVYHSIDTWKPDGASFIQTEARTKGLTITSNGVVISQEGT